MGKQLYVGNLDYATTEAALAELFGTVGQVVSVRLIMDRMTGRSKGFAFVEMADDAAATEAIKQLNGKTLDERAIRVDEARPKPQQDRPWDGGSAGDRGPAGGGGGDRRRRF